MANVAKSPVASDNLANSSKPQANPFEGTTKKVVLAENSKKAQEVLKGKGKAKTESKGKAETKKAPKKERAESNEHIGERLYAEKASEQKVLATFTKVYKDKKGITDKKFIKARAEIYMAIAEKRALAKKESKKEVKQAETKKAKVA